jgi:Tol biopolymer transport system component/DNA-binding winged helix-turn-helix (wHTH) protein
MNIGRVPFPRVRYRFSAFVLDVPSRRLSKDGAIVPLPAKAYELLLLLLANRERVVDKTEMMEAVWQGVVVEDNTLTRHISTLRKALGDEPAQPMIRTVSGHGYQFVAEVTELPDAAPAETKPDVEPLAEAPEPTPNPPVPSIDIPVRVQPSPRAHTTRFVAAAAVLLAAVIAGIVSWPLMRSGGADSAVRQFTFLSGLQRMPSWSPDGRSVVFVSDANGQPDLWIQKIDESRANPLTNSPGAESTPDWSPDGRWIAFRSEIDDTGLFVVSPDGGPMQKIADFGFRPRWSPDGTHILFTTSEYDDGVRKFYLVDPEGAAPQLLRPDLLQAYRMSHVAWHPKRNEVSFSGRQFDGVWRFCTTTIEPGAVRCSSIPAEIAGPAASAPLTLGRFAWSPSGTTIYFEGISHESRGLWRVEVTPSLSWKRMPERVTTGTTDDVDLALSRDGRRLLFSARTTQNLLWAFPFEPAAGKITGAGSALTTGAGVEQDVAVSPDGVKMAYRAVRAGKNELWERQALSGSERLLLPGDEWDRTAPVWSPDGTRLAYSRRLLDERGNRIRSAVAILAIGSRNEQVIMEDDDATSFTPTDWSADSRVLVGHCGRPNQTVRSICKIALPDVAAEKPIVEILANDPVRNLWQARLSPNQLWIAFLAVDATDTGVGTIYMIPANGGEWKSVTEGTRYDDKPRWAPDGGTLYFVSDRNGLRNVWGRRVEAEPGTPLGEPFLVTSFHSRGTTIATNRVRMQFALSTRTLFLPLEKSAGELWLVEGLHP